MPLINLTFRCISSMVGKNYYRLILGSLGELRMSIPWNDLKNKPVKIEISDVHLIAIPKQHSDYSPESEAEKRNVNKQQKLQEVELLESQVKSVAKTDAQSSSFFTQIITTILDNIQLSIKNIHLRIETPNNEMDTESQSCDAIGIALAGLSIISTDGDWVEAFIQNEIREIFKVILK